jgi:hypothetical protein
MAVCRVPHLDTDCNHAASRIVRRRFADATVHLTRHMPWFDEGLQRRWRGRNQPRLL